MTKAPIKHTSPSCLTCHARAGSMFSGLEPPDVTDLDRMRQVSIYPSGAIVFIEGEEPRGVYCVCAGRVKLSTGSSDGRTVIVGVATVGDVLGIRALLSGKPHDLMAETLEPTQLSFIKRDDFLGFLSRHGNVSLRLAQRLSDELYEAYRGIRDVALKRSCDRLAELLLRLCETHGEPVAEGIKLRINLSQEELAEMIGSTRRTLTRALTKLRQLGIVESRRRAMIIRDRAALEHSLSSERLF